MDKRIRESILREASLMIDHFIDKQKYLNELKIAANSYKIQWKGVLNRWNNVLTMLLLYTQTKEGSGYSDEIFSLLSDKNIRFDDSTEYNIDTILENNLECAFDFNKFAKECIKDTLVGIKEEDMTEGTDKQRVKATGKLGNKLLLADAVPYYKGTRLSLKSALRDFISFIGEDLAVKHIKRNWGCFHISGFDWAKNIASPLPFLYIKFTFYCGKKNILPDEAGFENAEINLASIHLSNTGIKVSENQSFSDNPSLLNDLTDTKSEELKRQITDLLKNATIPSTMSYKKMTDEGKVIDASNSVNLSLRDVKVLGSAYNNACGVVCKFSQSIPDTNIITGRILSTADLNVIKSLFQSNFEIADLKANILGGDLYVSFVPFIQGLSGNILDDQKTDGKSWSEIISDANDNLVKDFISKLNTTASNFTPSPKVVAAAVSNFEKTGTTGIENGEELVDSSISQDVKDKLPKDIADFIEYYVNKHRDANVQAIKNLKPAAKKKVIIRKKR